MRAAIPFRPGRRRPRPGSAGLRRTALAPLALAAFGFVVLLGAAPAAGQLVVINQDDFEDVVEGDAGTNTAYPIRVWLRESGVREGAVSTSTVDFQIRPSTGFRIGRTMTGPATGTLTFLPGESEQTVTYMVVGDDDFESNEVFTFAVFNVTGSARFSGVNTEESRTGRIINDDFPTLSITGTSTAEGAQGSTTTLSFTVALDLNGVHHAPGAEFKYRVTGDSTATAGDDYVTVPGDTLTKPRGAWTDEASPTEFSWTIDVEVNGDDTVEVNEKVEIEIYDATVEIADPNDLPSVDDNSYPVLTDTAPNVIGTGTIVNDDLPTFSVAPASVTEGATGTRTTLLFTVTASEALPVATELTWTTTASGTAAAGEDFEAASGTVSFAVGETSKRFRVTVIGDDTYEPDEVMEVEVVSPATATPITGRGTIVNDEPRPRISFDSPSVREGDDGDTTDLVFTLTMDPASHENVTVRYETATDSSTATAGESSGTTDFDGVGGVAGVSFASGSTTKTISVTVNGDNDVEEDETVALHIVNIVGDAELDTSTLTMARMGAMLKAGTDWLATGTILDDEPEVSIHPLSVLEGASGTTKMVDLRFTLDRAAATDVTVTYGLAMGGSAQVNNPSTGFEDDDDLRWPGGDLTIPMRSASGSVSLTVIGDDRSEGNETAVFAITAVAGHARIGAASSATVTILDDEFPTVSIDSPSVGEGDSGTTDLVFTASLSIATATDVTFRYEVTDAGTAESGVDYLPRAAGRLTIPRGDTTVPLPVQVVGDGDWEPDETVVVRISDPRFGGRQDPNLMIGTATGTGTIINDDPPGLLIDSPEAEEASGSLVFTVSLQAATSGDVTVEYVLGGTATSSDYGTPMPASLLRIAAGATTTTLTVPLLDDGIGERHETVTVTLRNPVGAGLLKDRETGTGRILNDDLPPLTVTPPEPVREGDTNDQPLMVFNVERADIGVEEEFRYEYEVVATSSTAEQGFDFTTATNTLLFPIGSLRQRIEITVFGDDIHEGDETVFLRIVNPSSGLRIATSTGTIRNDDDRPLPRVVIGSASADEGAAGATTTLTFTASLLTAATNAPVTVDWAVTGDAAEDAVPATVGVDFEAGNGTVTFAPGSVSETFEVTVIGDNEVEPDETLKVTLSNASGTEIWVGEATGTIRDDDLALSLAGSPEAYESASGTLSFEVKLSAATSVDVSFRWAVTGGTADADDDLVTASGTDTIPANALSATIRVQVRNDEAEESDETVEITLSSTTNGVAVPTEGATAVGTIIDDEGTLTVAIEEEPPVVTEGTNTHLVFTVRLSKPASAELRIPYEIVVDEGTARGEGAGADYMNTATSVTILPNMTSAEIRIAVPDDSYGETDATVVVRLSAPTDATEPVIVRRAKGTGTIRDDDAVKTGIDSTVSVTPDGETADGLARFVVNVLPPFSNDLTVSYEVEGGTVHSARGLARAADVQSSAVIPAREKGIEFLVRPNAGTRTVSFTVPRVSPTAGVGPHPSKSTAVLRVTRIAVGPATRALKYVLAGIGRTVATNIVDIIWDRAGSHRSGAGGTHATVGGRRVDTRAFADDGDGALLRAAVGLAGDLLGVKTDSVALLRDAERRLARGGGLGAFRDWMDLPDGRDFAARTDFALSFANGEGLAPYTFWGRGNLTTFDSGKLDGGPLGDFSADGEVVAGHLGLDYRLREDLLVGVALSHTTGDVDYGFAGSGDRGGVDTELTGVHPYLHLMSPDGLGVWGTLGYGTGSADLDPENGDTVTTDLAMEMLAFGVRDELAPLEDVDLAVKGDAFMAGISADEVTGVEAVDSDVFRARVALEGSRERVLEEGGRERVLEEGGVLVGRFELGARLDGGDAEEGFGADLAAGFDWAVPDLGLKVRGRGSMLLVHEESGFREWGLGLGLVWDPGVEGRGVRFSVEPTWHAPVAGGAAAMWDAGPGGGAGPASARGASLDARLGYGIGAFGDRALATVFGELGRADGDMRLRLGAGLDRPDAGGLGPALELYGERRDRAAGPEHSLFLKGRLGF